MPHPPHTNTRKGGRPIGSRGPSVGIGGTLPPVRTGSIDHKNDGLFSNYTSPVVIYNLYALRDYPIPMLPMYLADYLNRTYDLLLKSMGVYAVDSELEEMNLGYELETMEIIYAKLREFWMVTFKIHAAMLESGPYKGISTTMLIFQCMMTALNAQGIIYGSKKWIRRRGDAESVVEAYDGPSQQACDVSFYHACKLGMAVHGPHTPIASYTQKEAYVSWEMMAKRFALTDLRNKDVLADVLGFRRELLYRIARIVCAVTALGFKTESSSPADRDMHDMSYDNYIQYSSTSKRVSTRYVQEVMHLIVAGEMSIYGYLQQISVEDMEASDEDTLSLLANLLESHLSRDTHQAKKGDVAVSNAEQGVSRFSKTGQVHTKAAVKLLVQEIENNFLNVQPRLITNTAFTEELIEDLRVRMVPPGYRARFTMGNNLIPAAEIDQIENELYPVTLKFFMISHSRKQPIDFFLDDCHMHDMPFIRHIALAHIGQQIIMNHANYLWYKESVCADHNAVLDLLLPTPSTNQSPAMGHYHVNAIERVQFCTSDVFYPDGGVDCDTSWSTSKAHEDYGEYYYNSDRAPIDRSNDPNPFLGPYFPEGSNTPTTSSFRTSTRMEPHKTWSVPVTTRTGSLALGKSSPLVIGLCKNVWVFYANRFYPTSGIVEAYVLWLLIVMVEFNGIYWRLGKNSIDISAMHDYLQARLESIADTVAPDIALHIKDHRVSGGGMSGRMGAVYDSSRNRASDVPTGRPGAGDRDTTLTSSLNRMFESF